MNLRFLLLILTVTILFSSVFGKVSAQDTRAVVDISNVDSQIMKRITLPAATPIIFSMDKTLATDKREKIEGEKRDKRKERFTNRGEIFYMSVVDDVSIDGAIIIPRGSRGVGEILSVTGRGGFGKSGKIEVKLNFVEVRGKRYEMEGAHLQKGKGQGNLAAAGVILAGPVAGIFIKGEEADIPAGTRLTFRTKDDIILESDEIGQ